MSVIKKDKGILSTNGTTISSGSKGNPYLDILGKNYNAGTNAFNPDAKVSNDYLDEYQKLADAKDYQTLLDKSVADYNLKMNTQKYLNNQLANQGLNNSGYGSSLQAGTQNAYMNLLGQDYSNYQNSVRQNYQDALSRQETASKENDEQVITYLNSATTQDQLDQVLSDYGYSDISKAPAYVRAMYNLKSSAIANQETASTGKIALSDLGNVAISSDNGSETFASKFGYELNAINNAVARGELSSGEVLRIVNGYDGTESYLRYNADGTFTIASSGDYDKATSKGTIKDGKWTENAPKTPATKETTKSGDNASGTSDESFDKWVTDYYGRGKTQEDGSVKFWGDRNTWWTYKGGKVYNVKGEEDPSMLLRMWQLYNNQKSRRKYN